jgi:hypothetical protein
MADTTAVCAKLVTPAGHRMRLDERVQVESLYDLKLGDTVPSALRIDGRSAAVEVTQRLFDNSLVLLDLAVQQSEESSLNGNTHYFGQEAR